MSRSVCALVWMLFCVMAAHGGLVADQRYLPLPESVSRAKWIFAAEARKGGSTNACLRLKVDIRGEVKKAEFWWWAERCVIWLNGRRVSVGRLPRFDGAFPEHVIASGRDFAAGLRQGRNVFAFDMSRRPDQFFTFGLMLRGDVEYADGRIERYFSCADQFKSSETPAPGWTEADFDDSGWRAPVELGDVLKATWCNWGDVPGQFCTKEEYAEYCRIMTTGFPLERLLTEPSSPNARVDFVGTTPVIETNGRRFPPYVHNLHLACSVERDRMLERMRDAGTHIGRIMQIKGFWGGKRETDFSEYDRELRRVLAIDPEIRIILCLQLPVEYYREWLVNNPDELAGFAQESPSKNNSGDYFGNPMVPSHASVAFRRCLHDYIAKFGDYCRRQPWGRRILSVELSHGGSGDGMPWGCHMMPDTGVAMTRAFRRFLKRKYGSDENLRKAWDDPGLSLATVEVPDAQSRNGAGYYLRDVSDARDRRLLDYYTCYHEEFGDYMISFGRSVKSAFPGALAGAFYGYVILSYEPEGSTAMADRVLASGAIDYFLATTRGYNLTDGLDRNLPSVLRRYGKYTTIEGDVRTHLGLNGRAERKWCCRTPAETRSTVSKFVANALFIGAGWHTVDFAHQAERCWFDCPEALEPLSAGVRAWKDALRQPIHDAAEIAVVVDPDVPWREGFHPHYRNLYFSDTLLTLPLQTLNFSGYAYDLYAPEDFVAEKRDFKAVVFVNTYENDAALKAAAAKARRNGATVVWCYAPGLQDATGFSEASMKATTGLDLGVVRERRPMAASGAIGALVAYQKCRYPHVGTYAESPRVFSRETTGTDLAKWDDDQTVAAVRKVLPDGSIAVFLGLPPNDVRQWAEIFRTSGCHRYTKPGFLVRRNSKYLMVFSGKNGVIPPESIVMTGQMDQSGVVEVSLERRADSVRDVFSGEVVAAGADSFTLRSDGPRVWLLEIK